MLSEYLVVTKDRSEGLKDPEKKLEPIVALLRSVVSKASSKGFSLHPAVSAICVSLVSVLNRFAQLTWLQLSCSAIFETLLSVPTHWPLIKPSTHSNLVRLYLNLLHSYPVSSAAAANAGIFLLLFSSRIPSMCDSNLDIQQSREKAILLVREWILPLQDFLRRADPKNVSPVIAAINRVMLEVGASFAHDVLSPIMTTFNRLLISLLEKPHSFEAISSFRIQMRLLVSPDGTFDSGIDGDEEKDSFASSSSSKAEIKSNKRTANDPSTLHATRASLEARIGLFAETDLYNSVLGLIDSQNHGDPLKAEKAKFLDYSLYSLYQLAISLFVKKLISIHSNSSTSEGGAKKNKGDDDPRQTIYCNLFASVLSNDDLLQRSSHSSSPIHDHLRNSKSSNDRLRQPQCKISWLQLTFVLVSENPFFFNPSWTLTLATDLLLLLEHYAGIGMIEIWIFRLLSALARATQLYRDSPSKTSESEEDAIFDSSISSGTTQSTEDFENRASHTQELLSCWERTWNVCTLKLGKIDGHVGEAALTLLERLLKYELISRALVFSSQASLLQPIIVKHYTWEALPFLATLCEKYPLAGSGGLRNETNYAESLLDWFDDALSKSYREITFQTESTVDPSLLASMLVTVITGAPINASNAVRSDSCEALLLPLQNAEFESNLRNLSSSRLLTPHLDPYRRFKNLKNSNVPQPLYTHVPIPNTIEDVPKDSVNMIDRMPLSDARKEELSNRLSNILTTRFGHTKIETPVLQTKKEALVLDGSKLIQLMRKQIFQGCLNLALLRVLPSTRTSLHAQLEMQLREISELIESNLQLRERDTTVTGKLFYETSRLALTITPITTSHIQQNSIDIKQAYGMRENSTSANGTAIDHSLVQILFKALLDSTIDFVVSVTPSQSNVLTSTKSDNVPFLPSSSQAANASQFHSSSQAPLSGVSASQQSSPPASQYPRHASFSESKSRILNNVEEYVVDYMDDFDEMSVRVEQESEHIAPNRFFKSNSGGRSASSNPDGASLSRQATEIALSPSTSSIVTLPFRLSSKMKCFVQAIGLQSSILTALPTGHQLIETTLSAIISSASVLVETDPRSHYPLIAQLVITIASRSSELSTEQIGQVLSFSTKILSFLSTTCVSDEDAAKFSSFLNATVMLIKGRTRSDSTPTQTNQRNNSSSSSLSYPNIRNSGGLLQSSHQVHARVPNIEAYTSFASEVCSLGRFLPWKARVSLQTVVKELLGMKPEEIGGDALYNDIQSILFRSLEDGDVHVRFTASTSICALFSYFTAHRVIVQDLLSHHLGKLLNMTEVLEAVATALQSLLLISSANPLVLDIVLVKLHEASTQHPIYLRYVPVILEMQMRALGYASRLDMLLDRLPHIFARWRAPMTQFPCFLYQLPNPKEFFTTYSSLIVQGILRLLLVSEENEDFESFGEFRSSRLEELSKVISSTPLELIRQNFDFAEAVSTLLRAHGKESAKRAEIIQKLLQPSSSTNLKSSKGAKGPSIHVYICISHMLKLIGDNVEVSDLMLTNSIDSSFEEMSRLNSDQNASSYPTKLFSELTLSAALRMLAQQNGFSSTSRMLASNSYYTLANVIKAMEECFFRSSDPTERARDVLGIRVIGNSSASSAVDTTMIMTSLLRFLGNSSHLGLQTVVVDSMRCVWNAVPEQIKISALNSTIFVDSFVDVISTCILRYKSYPNQLDPQVIALETQTTKLLKNFLFDFQGQPRIVLASYRGFPGFVHEAFESILTYFQSTAFEGDNSSDFLQTLARSTPDMSRIKLITSIDYFIKGVREGKAGIRLLLKNSNHISSVPPPRDPSSNSQYEISVLLGSALRSLVALSKSSDTQVQNRVSEAFEVIGIFDPSYLSLPGPKSPPKHKSSHQEIQAPHITPKNQESINTAKTSSMDLDPDLDLYLPPATAPKADNKTSSQEENIEAIVSNSSEEEEWHMRLENIQQDLLHCVSKVSSSQYEPLIPILRALSLKERSLSHPISTISRRILKALTTNFWPKRGAHHSPKESPSFFVSCWRDPSNATQTIDLTTNASKTPKTGNKIVLGSLSHLLDSALGSTPYETWICSVSAFLASSRAQDLVLQACEELLEEDHEFAESLFPLLVSGLFRDKGEELEAFETFLQRAADCPRAMITARRKHFSAIFSALQAIRNASIKLALAATVHAKHSHSKPTHASTHHAGGAAHSSSHRKTRASAAPSLVPDFKFLLPWTAHHVAKIALCVSLPSTALMFFEMWCETLASSSAPPPSSTLPNPQTLYSQSVMGTLRWPSHDAAASSAALQLAEDIFTSLGNTESVYGLRHLDISQPQDPTTLSAMLMQERDWPAMMSLYEVFSRPNSATSSPTLHRNFLHALQYGCHFKLMKNYVQGVLASQNYNEDLESEDLKEFHFQAAWRLSDWNATWAIATHSPLTRTSSSGASNSVASQWGAGSKKDPIFRNSNFSELQEDSMQSSAFPFHKLAFTCLRTTLQGDKQDAQAMLNWSRVQLLKNEFAFLSTEKLGDQLFPKLVQMQFFSDIQRSLSLVKELSASKKPALVAPSRASLFGTSNNKDSTSNVIDKRVLQLLEEWHESLEIIPQTTDRFELFEPIIALRGILISHIVPSNHVNEMQSAYWTRVVVAGRKTKNFQLSSLALENARSALHLFQKQQSQEPIFKTTQYSASTAGSSSKTANSQTGSKSHPSSSQASSQIPMSSQSPGNAAPQRTGAMKSLQSKYQTLSRYFALEECRLYWAQGNQRQAVAMARAQQAVLEKEGGNSVDLAKLLLLSGEWLGQSKLESPEVIYEQYLNRAATMLRDLKQDNENRSKAYFQLGTFSDTQYQLARERMHSAEWTETTDLQKRIAAVDTKEMDDKSKNLFASLYKEEIAAANERENHERKSKVLLHSAVSMYLYTLLKGDTRNTQAIFRLISLWFANNMDPQISHTIQSNITRINSAKFIPLFYQIASRISPQQSSFQVSLQNLIERLTTDHPHPNFYQLVALQSAKEQGRYASDSKYSTTKALEKAEVAQNLINRVRANIPKQIDAMLALAEAYKELIRVSLSSDAKSPPKSITSALLSWKYPNMVPVATLSDSWSRQSLSEGGKIENKNSIFIMSFAPQIRFVGGINRPCLIFCIGSDGLAYHQLVKGNDDMRQDAVMQQLFHTINTIIKSDHSTSTSSSNSSSTDYYQNQHGASSSMDVGSNSKSKQKISSISTNSNLRIRTYNVIPLSPSSGVLEWVSNTQPLGEYLVSGGNASAHLRYRPQDWPSSKCREVMDKVAKHSESAKQKAFSEVLLNFQPVLSNFFIENFPDANLWYERRLSYTQSMAVASIVGHMVGLGDRHSQNILLDKKSGEVIHIDFGIAFDQGKSLPVPERVPFRLTRDLVSAMGVVGVRGVFTQSCEDVAKILRERHSNLVTIAEVFLHDPLSKWLLKVNANSSDQRNDDRGEKKGPKKTPPPIGVDADQSTEPLGAPNSANKKDENKGNGDKTDDPDARNTKAAATLLRFKQKLLGQEDGMALSVAGQVQHLLTEAQDERKLALMYPGWAAWV